MEAAQVPYENDITGYRYHTEIWSSAVSGANSAIYVLPRIGLMQGKWNWPNLKSKNRAKKVTWKTWRANLETPGFRRNLGFYPKHDPPTATYGEIWLLRLHRLFIPSVSFNRSTVLEYSTVWEWRATRPQQSNLTICCCWWVMFWVKTQVFS